MQDSEGRVLGLDLAVAEDRPPDPLVLADVYEVEVEREREVRTSRMGGLSCWRVSRFRASDPGGMTAKVCAFQTLPTQ